MLIKRKYKIVKNKRGHYEIRRKFFLFWFFVEEYIFYHNATKAIDKLEGKERIV